MPKTKSPPGVISVGQGLAELVDDASSPLAVTVGLERVGQRAHAMTPDGTLVLLGAGRTLGLEDSASGVTRVELDVHEPITHARFSPDGSLLAVSEQAPHAALVLYDVHAPRELVRVERLAGMADYAPNVPRFTFSADGARLAYLETFRDDPIVWVLDREGRVERSVTLRGKFQGISLSSSPGCVLLHPLWGLPLLELELASGELRELLRVDAYLRDPTVGARGVALAVGGNDLWLGAFTGGAPARWPSQTQLDSLAKSSLARVRQNLEARLAAARNGESKSRLSMAIADTKRRLSGADAAPEGFVRYVAGRYGVGNPRGVAACFATDDRLVVCGRQELVLLSLEHDEPHERELLRAAARLENRVTMTLLGAHENRVLVEVEDGRTNAHATLVLQLSLRADALPIEPAAKKPAAKKPAAKKPAAKKKP